MLGHPGHCFAAYRDYRSLASTHYYNLIGPSLASGAPLGTFLLPLTCAQFSMSCSTDFCFQKEIIRKMGNPVPQNFLYTNIKQLLERIAPVMIDNSAIVALVTHIEGILPTGDADDAETDRLGDSENLESGMKLLLVGFIAFILKIKFWL